MTINIVNQETGTCVVCLEDNKPIQGHHPAHGMCVVCLPPILAGNPPKCPTCRAVITHVNGVELPAPAPVAPVAPVAVEPVYLPYADFPGYGGSLYA